MAPYIHLMTTVLLSNHAETQPVDPSKAHPWASWGKWKQFRCSFSLQASLTSTLLPIPCYLELQSQCHFEKESSITLSRAKQQEEMCHWGFRGVEIVPENTLSLKVSVSFCSPNLIVILYSSEEKKNNRKLQSVAGIIKQQIHHLLGEAETRGQSWQEAHGNLLMLKYGRQQESQTFKS